MGKAVPKNIKARARSLMEAFPDVFSSDFEKNKEFLNSLGLPFFKSTRNNVAGYISRQKHK